jgi:rhomboid protease GluP
VSQAQAPLIDQLLARSPRIPATAALIGANLVVFAAMLWHGAGLWHSDNGVQLAWGANFGPATQDGQWWRLGSALFLHFGLFHLAMNMLSLWDGGRVVERMFGPARFLAIYFAGGLTGNLLSLIVQGDRAVSGGASGAIFGVYGALMGVLWLERHGLQGAEFRRLFWGVALFSGLAIFLGFQITGIDNAAHIGGLLGGGLAGLALARPLGAVSRPARLAPRLAGIVLAAMTAALIAGIPEPRYRWSEEVRVRAEIGAFLREEARIRAHWGAILGRAREGGASFDQLAGQIEAEIADPYADSFEQLARLHLDPAAPSAPTLAALREYAELRRDAARELAEGLRAKDPAQIRESLEKASGAARRVQPPPRRRNPRTP